MEYKQAMGFVGIPNQFSNAQLPNDKSLLHSPKKVTPRFFKIQVEQARSFFLRGSVYHYLTWSVD